MSSSLTGLFPILLSLGARPCSRCQRHSPPTSSPHSLDPSIWRSFCLILHQVEAISLKTSPFPSPCKVLVNQLCPTLCNPMDCSPPGSSVHGILQARILEWVAIHFSRGFLNPEIQTRSPALQADSLPSKPQGKPLQTSLYLEKCASCSLQLRSPYVLLMPVPPTFFCNLLHQLPLFLSPMSLSLQICSRAPYLKENKHMQRLFYP